MYTTCNPKPYNLSIKFSSIKNALFKEFWILILQYNNSLRAPWKRYAKFEPKSKRGSKES